MPRGRAKPLARAHIQRVIRISITAEAFAAIAATMPLGSNNHEAETAAAGERFIWLPAAVVARLKAMRGPGETYSDVILRVAAA